MTRLRSTVLALARLDRGSGLRPDASQHRRRLGRHDHVAAGHRTPCSSRSNRMAKRSTACSSRRSASCRSPARFTGSDMKFAFTFPVDGQPLLITMTGKVDGEAITGKADFGGFAEGDWSAKRVGWRTPWPRRQRRPRHPLRTRRRLQPRPRTAGGFGGKWDVMLKTPGGDFPASATLTDEGGKAVGHLRRARWVKSR